MLATTTGTIVMIVLSIIGLAVIAFAIYITFFPLVKTIGGGLFAIKHARAKQKDLAAETPFIVDAKLGLTMADGGEKLEEKDNTQ